ncbi:BTAD domain-containing putative transcriptional regulator [Streptomyces canus]|uniref:AfsR/SARP family transcriptional regulator n=1 Tax=Streptomyces canus TaxID=58343 RepID=UPI00036C1A9C|nr:BTAD domain-containing putative transcriptional regulator [Streptomyces canus]
MSFTFQVLGELKVFSSDYSVPITPGRQEAVLAALLLESGRLLSSDHLIRLLWAEDPPETARTQVQICVSRVRKALAAGNVEATIVTRSAGYLLQIGNTALDLNVFRDDVAEARTFVGGGRTADAAEKLRKAVALWNGPCLNGISSELLARVAQQIDEERLAATETIVELELSLGRHHQLTAEVGRLVEENPLRERFRSQLMLALYRSGRQAEALDVYRRGRALFQEELGLEPSQDLRRLEQAIITDDPDLRHEPDAITMAVPIREARPVTEPDGTPPSEDGVEHPRSVVIPRQLPIDTADFVGHAGLVTEAEEVLTSAQPDRATGVVVITGRPGIGKSTFATRVAHRLADAHFPDGQLFCQLRGGRADPVNAREVLGRFLRALGLPGPAIPDSLEERAEIYRSLLAARRILVVLDDAASEEQILPLLPGSRSCGALITSRARLTALPGAYSVPLETLNQQDSLELLNNVIGSGRVNGEPEAANALARAVDGLPLALRIVAARMAARPHWSLASMVQRLADERRRLDELAHGEMTVRASLSLTYNGLPDNSRKLLRLLSLTNGSTFPSWVGGALLNDSSPFPSDIIEPLADVQMIDVAGHGAAGELRYRFHDIVRLFARERMVAESDEAERGVAIRRVGGAWLSLVAQAQRHAFGYDYFSGSAPHWDPPKSHTQVILSQPMEWLDSERENLGLAVDSLATEDEDEYAWELAVNLAPFYEARGYLDHWARTHCKALTAVRRADNHVGQAALLASLGSLYIDRRQLPEARKALTSAQEIFETLGHRKGLGLCRRDLGTLEQLTGRDTAAMRLFQQAERDFEAIDDAWARAAVLTARAVVLLRQGDGRRVEAELREALQTWRDLGYVGGQARAMQRIGQLHMHRGQLDDAREVLAEVLGMVVDEGDVIGEGHLLHNLGRVHVELGRPAEATALFERALAVRESILDKVGAASVRVSLAELSLRAGETRRARALLENAMEAFDMHGVVHERERVERLMQSVTTARSLGHG